MVPLMTKQSTSSTHDARRMLLQRTINSPCRVFGPLASRPPAVAKTLDAIMYRPLTVRSSSSPVTMLLLLLRNLPCMKQDELT